MSELPVRNPADEVGKTRNSQYKREAGSVLVLVSHLSLEGPDLLQLERRFWNAIVLSGAEDLRLSRGLAEGRPPGGSAR